MLERLHEALPFINTMLLFAAGFWIGSQRKRLDKVIDKLADRVTKVDQRLGAVQEIVEQPPAVVPNTGSPVSTVSWEKFRHDWKEARDRIEHVVDNITDGRVRGKYERTPRYSYADLISMLKADGFLSAGTAQSLSKLNEAYLKYRPAPHKLDAESYEALRNEYLVASRKLPIVPRGNED